MTHPMDKSLFDQDGPAEQEVREVYRNLPHPEPGTALDARIRAAVAQELQGEEKSHSCIVLPWWQRPGIPMALAASLLIAVGLGGGWFFADRFVNQPDSGRFQLAQAPVADVPATADAPEMLAKEAVAVPDASRKPQHERVPPLPAPHVAEHKLAGEVVSGRLEAVQDHAPDVEMREPPVPATPSLPAPASLSAPENRLSETHPVDGRGAAEQRFFREDARLGAAKARENALPMAARSSQDNDDFGVSKRGPGPDSAVPASMDATTLARLRALLEAGRRDEARDLLRVWRRNYPDVLVPEELGSLLKELEAENPRVVPAQ